IFSCKQELKLTNELKKTAFSIYEKYDIKILSVTNYYCLSKDQLIKKDILRHSLYIVEKEQAIRNLIFLALFYFKYQKEFNTQHLILDNLKLVLNGKNIKGYPSYNEIKERAEVYNIKLK
ncbi:MAG: hypothetical protein KAQ83_03920, partial [Nanoarchaeota archaeon]|nr:hypothetical protein [Nanoarchaeota archaeon]